MFSDFQCPYCRQFAQPIRELMAQGVDGARTTVTFKNFPLGFHADAQLSAQAALAAKEQGKFWEMHDLIFSNQSAIKRDDLLGYAKKLGLDMARFAKDLDSERIKKAIASDLAEGQKVGVIGTPTFFLNGTEYSGTKSFDQLKQLIQTEHNRAQALAEIKDTFMS
ncbi:MAG TPA: DsbA family protein, partial [Bryobacteraceae bacterium]|nr:DsbA family protein [Bryobacteraceae bacterium]